MNHSGELAPLCEMTRPKIGIITSIGTSHMEYLGSRENIAREKCTLARCLPEDGFMIFSGGLRLCGYDPSIHPRRLY